jgi:hypothetical protein
MMVAIRACIGFLNGMGAYLDTVAALPQGRISAFPGPCALGFVYMGAFGRLATQEIRATTMADDDNRAPHAPWQRRRAKPAPRRRPLPPKPPPRTTSCPGTASTSASTGRLPGSIIVLETRAKMKG